jgi:MoxR-like ATPase
LFASQALAALQGREYVTPDDIKTMAIPVLAHRLIVRPEHRIKGVTNQMCVSEILQRIPIPIGAVARA